MEQKTFIEKLLVAMAYLALAGGIGCGLLCANGIWESQTEMCFPQAVFVAAGAVFAAVALWAVLMTAANVACRTRRIEKRLQEKAH